MRSKSGYVIAVFMRDQDPRQALSTSLAKSTPRRLAGVGRPAQSCVDQDASAIRGDKSRVTGTAGR